MAQRKKSTKRKPVMRKQAAKAEPVPDAPSDSAVQRTAPFEREMDALGGIDLDNFNVIECDRRISLIARFALEAGLRDRAMSSKDRADLAIRAINTLEGSRTRTELWVQDETKKVPIDVNAYNEELQERQKRLTSLVDAIKRRDMLGAATEAADALTEDEDCNDEQHTA